MKKLLQIILFAFFIISTDAITDVSSNSHVVGDISINNLFETNQEFQENYTKYNSSTLLDLSMFHDVEIYILFGTWCHDSKREVPRFLQLLNSLNIQENYIHLIGLNFLKNEPLNRGKHFQIKKTPTFVFLRNQKEIGRIVEMPEISLEADLLKILGPLD